MQKLFTFGYGNRKNYEQLEAYIREHSIDVLVDVRIKPRAWTRKWWGDQVEKFCESQGVEYISARELGNTSGKANWIPENKEEAGMGVAVLVKTLEKKNVVLMCAELDFNRCHRTEVAETAQEVANVIEIIHLA